MRSWRASAGSLRETSGASSAPVHRGLLCGECLAPVALQHGGQTLERGPRIVEDACGELPASGRARGPLQDPLSDVRVVEPIAPARIGHVIVEERPGELVAGVVRREPAYGLEMLLEPGRRVDPGRKKAVGLGVL